MTYLSVEVDEEINKLYVHGKGGDNGAGEISTPNSKVKVFVIPTNEELVIARDTRDIVLNLKK